MGYRLFGCKAGKVEMIEWFQTEEEADSEMVRLKERGEYSDLNIWDEDACDWLLIP